MTALAVLLVLAALAAAGAAARLHTPGLFRAHTGRHTYTYAAAHPLDALAPRHIDIGTWI